MKIIKRDGQEEEFDQNKIIDAVLAAFKEVDGELSDYAYIKAGNIADYIQDEARPLTVEEVQDLVENGLMSTKRKDVARAYITYRYRHKVAREISTDFIDAIGEKLKASNVQNQNANVDEHSFGGRMGEATGVMTKNYALNYIVSPMARNNHLNNEIYIHDLDSYAVGMHNCLSIPFDDLLANGFNTRQTDVRPANSINTAFQLVAVIFQLQSLQQFGGVSATHLDWTMVPYVRKSFVKHYRDGLRYCEHGKWLDGMEYDSRNNITSNLALSKKGDHPRFMETLSIEDEYFEECGHAYNYAMDMTIKEVYQAVEGMYHNLNY